MGMTWPEARQYCIAQGRKMAKISNEGEQIMMADFLNSIDPAKEKYFWIGLNDREAENTFLWEDGSSTSYRTWWPNEPNDSTGNEDCVHVGRSSDRHWNDLGCDRDRFDHSIF